MAGWLGGATVLGAVDSLPLGVTEGPGGGGGRRRIAGQGVSEGPRDYDYGPGGNFAPPRSSPVTGARWRCFIYEGRHLFSLDGVRANHFLQRTRVDLLLPLRGSLGFGASGEYFKRHTYYQDATHTELEYHYPQVRAYFTWRLS